MQFDAFIKISIALNSPLFSCTGKVTLDVTHFAPEELNVKLVDNYLVIEGKHDEKQEGRGFISRHFVRRYEVPVSPDFEIKPEDVNCTLNSSGILTVEVLLEPPVDEESRGVEKVIPITMTSTTSSSLSKQYRHGHSSSSRVHLTKSAQAEDSNDMGAPSTSNHVNNVNENHNM